jgi:hypothetical protein
MAVLNKRLGIGRVAGDDLEIRVTITSLPATISTAWLTIKDEIADLDAAALMQKEITSSDVPGTGQIEDTGADGTGILRFDLTNDDTALLATTAYEYDVQILLSTTKLNTPQRGLIQMDGAEVTKSTS